MDILRMTAFVMVMLAPAVLFSWSAYAQKTDPFGVARLEMIKHQLKGRDITDEAVLQAMNAVPRERFVGQAQQDMAYADFPLPIGYGQTISQPYVVAFMTQMIEVRAEDRVLEIGTGCGYQAAVLARLAQQVYTIEIIKPLADDARKLLAELGYTNIFIKAGDGFDGWPEHAPFDKIILTCAVKELPPALIEQLQEGGRIIAPIGAPGGVQELILATKTNGRLQSKKVLPVRFVPMTGKALEE
jgi:protein-L-isoaspartate(D-aspartate) O-methyltransferase